MNPFLWDEPKMVLNDQCSSTPAAAAGCCFPSIVRELFLPGPFETFTLAGLRSRSPSKNPRLNSWITIPSFISCDSSRATASCNCNQRKKNPSYPSDIINFKLMIHLTWINCKELRVKHNEKINIHSILIHPVIVRKISKHEIMHQTEKFVHWNEGNFSQKIELTEGSNGLPTVATAETRQLLNVSTNCLYIPW